MNTQSIRRPLSKRRLPKPLLIAVVVAGIAVAALPRPALALFGIGLDIIFDPSNFAQNVEQVARLIEQIVKVEQQIENELRMLAHLDLTTLPGMTRASEQVEQVLHSSGEYQNPDPRAQLESRYPMDFRDAPRDALENLQGGWNESYRDILVESRGVQNQIYADLDAGSERVAALINASNSAEGVTAAVQAHNELLAASSTELSKLQALKLSRARLKAERSAREQSDLAYRRARRDALMRDAGDPGSSGPILIPFGN